MNSDMRDRSGLRYEPDESVPLALALGRHGPGPAQARLSTRFPTAALAIFETGIDDWAAFRDGSARLAAFKMPKEMR